MEAKNQIRLFDVDIKASMVMEMLPCKAFSFF